MREFPEGRSRVAKRRFDDDDPTYLKRAAHDEPAEPELDTWELTTLAGGDRWSTWDQSAPLERGPQPHPEWLVTELAAVDTELGILKTGKEADVFLIDRGVPGTDRRCLLAAKRYRSSNNRMFQRDAGYLEGRRVRESRDNRAMAKRTTVGLQMIAQQWARAEFGALCDMYRLGVPVPYPVQIVGTEVLEEFIGDPVTQVAAPRLAALKADGPKTNADAADALRADAEEAAVDLADLWAQLVNAVSLMARAGFAHGDLSAYNILVHEGRLVIIDLPQIVDVVANPQGRDFLIRDAMNVATWFTARGYEVSGDDFARELIAEAHIR